MAKPMHFDGSFEPVHIFQDELLDEETPTTMSMTSHAPMPTVTKPNRRPLSSSNANMVLNPPPSSAHGCSPFKPRASTSPRASLKSPQRNKLHMVSMAPPAMARASTDSLLKKPYLSKFKTGVKKPAHQSKFVSLDKENMQPQLYPAPTTLDLSVEMCYQKPNGKRALLDAAPITDDRPAKRTKMDEYGLPPWDSFPPILDDGGKPPHSYAQLIGMAILRSPPRRLTLAQIYKWISDNYKFYNPNDSGWQNSIRHNLSLHKNFVKIERPKDDPGKGNYWGIEPGTEHQFLKEKPSRKSIPTAENLPVMSTRLEPSRPHTAMPQISTEPTLPPAMPAHFNSLPQFPTSQATLPAEHSSDATIPNSDHVAAEDSAERATANDNDFNVDSTLYSPLPANLHSSPPISKHGEARSRTPPPPLARNLTSSAPRTHKRKFASVDDSGYISSLESSAMRPVVKPNHTLTSDVDLIEQLDQPERPRVRRSRGGGRGRAEEEIARLRNSSPYSPSKGRSNSMSASLLSSPIRQIKGDKLKNPLTPMTKMPPPAQPPASISPNTNLRMHRAAVRTMLQSPIRQVIGTIDENSVPWSPAFKLDDHDGEFADLAFGMGDLDSMQASNGTENTLFPTFSIDAGSPIKQSVKRARLDRSQSAAVLGESTNSANKKFITSAPARKLLNPSPIKMMDTPSKFFEGLSSPSKGFQQSPLRDMSPSKFLDMPTNVDWPGLSFDTSDFGSMNGMSGGQSCEVDLSQGFDRIGSNSQPAQMSGQNTTNNHNHHRNVSKPPLGRSYSTNF